MVSLTASLWDLCPALVDCEGPDNSVFRAAEAPSIKPHTAEFTLAQLNRITYLSTVRILTSHMIIYIGLLLIVGK